MHKVTVPGKNTNYLVLKSPNPSKLSRSRLRNHMWRLDLQRDRMEKEFLLEVTAAVCF